MTPEQFEKARSDPKAVFGTPEEILNAVSLTDEQKIEILRRWEYDAAEEAVAVEEGMPGEETDLLRRIVLALGQIVGRLDQEHTGPSKQHGLSRRAVKKSAPS
jgi:hypothetical protein